jgi:hypothetical protein
LAQTSTIERPMTATSTPSPTSRQNDLAGRQVTDLEFARALRYVHSRWLQGEHVSLIGPTGAGKTYFKRFLLRKRDFITSFVTKEDDDELHRIFREEGFTVQGANWDGANHDLVALWPKQPRGRSFEEFLHAQKWYFNDAIDKMAKQKGWTFDFDEISYMTDFLHMDRRMRWLLQQGRSSKLTVVAATQRPAFIPLAFYSMPSWLVFWNNNDDTDLKRIQGLGGVNGKVLRSEVMNLAHREIIIVHNRHPYERIRTLVRV